MTDRVVKIKGVADFSSIKREANSLQRSIEDAFGDGVKIIDEDSVDLLKNEVTRALAKVQDQIAKLRAENEKLNKTIESGVDSESEKNRIGKRILENVQEQIEAERQLQKLKKSEVTLVTGMTDKQRDDVAKKDQAKLKQSAKEQKANQKTKSKEEQAALKEFASKERAEKQKLTKEEKAAAKAQKAEQTKMAKDLALAAKSDASAKNAAAKELTKKAAEEARVKKKAEDEERKRMADDLRAVEAQSRKKRALLGHAGSTVMGAVSGLPGVGEAASVAGEGFSAGSAAAGAGMSTGAVVGLGLLGAAAAAAAVAVYRMKSGFDVYKAQVPTLLQLSAQGRVPGGASMTDAARLGYGPGATLEAQKGIQQAFGSRVSAQGDSNRLSNVLTASRGLGLSPGDISGAGNSLRANAGTDQAQKQMALIIEKAFTAGIDKSQSGSYLAAAVGLLGELNQSGVSNANQLLGVMAGLVGKGNMSPEMAAKSLGGINSAISGSSGESNAFFQMAAAKQGLGGGSLLGTQFAVSQGLMGVDMGAMGNQVGDTKSGRMGMQSISEMGLGDSNYSQKFAKGILEEINRRFDQSTKTGRQATLGFAGQMFGAKSAPEAVKVLALLEKISKSGATDKEKKFLTDLSKDPEAAWREKVISALDQTAMATAKTAAFYEKGQFDLGQASAPIFNALTSVLTSLDNHLAGMVGSATSDGEGLPDIGGFLKDQMKEFSDSVGGLFDKFLDDPIALGVSIGKGFTESAMTIIDELKKFLEPLVEYFKEFAKAPGEKLSEVGGAISDTTQGAIETLVDSVGDFVGGLATGAKQAITGDPAAAATGGPSNTDMVAEQKRTNQLLEKSLRHNSAPKAGRVMK